VPFRVASWIVFVFQRAKTMTRKKSNKLSQILERFSLSATKATGTSMAFILALSVIIVWGVTGPLFHYSDTWQLVINTSTTIVTFLMVFLIQRAKQGRTGDSHQAQRNSRGHGRREQSIDRCRRSYRRGNRNASPALSEAGSDGQEGHEANPEPLSRRS
jgi:low affinity Fe/Cu permease